MWSSVVFAWEILRRATSLAAGLLGTSPLAWLVAGIIFLSKVIRRLVREGRATTWKETKEDLLEGTILTAAIAVSIILFYALVIVPRQIRTDANKVSPPDWRLSAPRPPSCAYYGRSRIVVTARHLTETQNRMMLAALAKYPNQRFTIDCVSDNPEARTYAEEMREVLSKAGWKMISYAPMWNPGFSNYLNLPNFFEVQWFDAGAFPAPEAGRALREVLKSCCAITADGVRGIDSQMEANVVYIWVGSALKAHHTVYVEGPAETCLSDPGLQ